MSVLDITLPYANAKELFVRKHIVTYAQDGFTFRFYATCISPNNQDTTQLPADSLTLFMCHGLGQHTQTYYPVIKELFNLQEDPNSPLRIRAVWLLEHANHGDSSLLNENILSKHYPLRFPLQYYGLGVIAFLKSSLVNIHDPYLIPVAHCGGSGGTIFAVDTLRRQYGIKMRCVIVIEPMLWDRRIEPDFNMYSKRVHQHNKKREYIWKDVDEAMAYYVKRAPWNTWNPEVLQWTSRSAFRLVPHTFYLSEKSWVTEKTTLQQLSATFEAEAPLLSAEILVELIPRMPVHVIMAEKQNMWTKPMYENQVGLLEKYKSSLASFGVIAGAGHTAPQDDPKGTAMALFEALHQEYKRYAGAQSSKQVSKL